MPVALITGASAGLGVDFATQLAERAYDLILVARNGERMNKLADDMQNKFKTRCFVVPQDLARPGSAEQLVRKVEKLGLSPDVLINNAGYAVWGPFSQSNFAEMSGMLQLNMTTLAELTHLLLPAMLQRKQGHILNVASTAAFQAGPWLAGYYASKAFVLSFSEALAVELEGTGVTITALCPGPTKTEFFDRAKMGDSRIKHMVLADSAVCVRRGLDAMFAGKAVEVDGLMNRLLILSVKGMPRSVTRRVTGYINQSTKSHLP